MKKIKKIIITCLALVMVFTFTSCNETTKDNTKEVQEITSYMGVNVTYTSTTLENGSIEDTVDEIYDSVVTIEAYISGELYGTGSGVIFGQSDTQSFIVTCHHVIESCTEFEVVLTDETVLTAQLVGGDSESDIAVLAVNAKNLCYATWFEDSDILRKGSTVICIGNPLGTLPGSVSTGIVSFNNREVMSEDYYTRSLIQTDVAINSGNSGGGLFNAAGALIGIVNSKYSKTGVEGLGFAVPSNQAKSIVADILETAIYEAGPNTWQQGYVEGRWNIGFTLGYGGYGFVRSSIGVASAATNETSSDYGLLKANDLITMIQLKFKDENKYTQTLSNISASTCTLADVYTFIFTSNMEIGDIISFTISREGKSLTVDVPLVQYKYSI